MKRAHIISAKEQNQNANGIQPDQHVQVTKYRIRLTGINCNSVADAIGQIREIDGCTKATPLNVSAEVYFEFNKRTQNISRIREVLEPLKIKFVHIDDDETLPQRNGHINEIKKRTLPPRNGLDNGIKKRKYIKKNETRAPSTPSSTLPPVKKPALLQNRPSTLPIGKILITNQSSILPVVEYSAPIQNEPRTLNGLQETKKRGRPKGRIASKPYNYQNQEELFGPSPPNESVLNKSKSRLSSSSSSSSSSISSSSFSSSSDSELTKSPLESKTPPKRPFRRPKPEVKESLNLSMSGESDMRESRGENGREEPGCWSLQELLNGNHPNDQSTLSLTLQYQGLESNIDTTVNQCESSEIFPISTSSPITKNVSEIINNVDLKEGPEIIKVSISQPTPIPSCQVSLNKSLTPTPTTPILTDSDYNIFDELVLKGSISPKPSVVKKLPFSPIKRNSSRKCKLTSDVNITESSEPLEVDSVSTSIEEINIPVCVTPVKPVNSAVLAGLIFGIYTIFPTNSLPLKLLANISERGIFPKLPHKEESTSKSTSCTIAMNSILQTDFYEGSTQSHPILFVRSEKKCVQILLKKIGYNDFYSDFEEGNEGFENISNNEYIPFWHMVFIFNRNEISDENVLAINNIFTKSIKDHRKIDYEATKKSISVYQDKSIMKWPSDWKF